MYDTLLVNGVDLATVCTCVQSLDGLYTVGAPRGENVVIPGVDGETWVDKPYGTQTVTLGLVLAGATTAAFNDGLRTLRSLIQPGTLLDLERRVSYTAGNEAHFATGEWASGLTPSLSLMRFGKTTVSLKVLDGLWYAGSSTVVSYANGTVVNVVGEARTENITITMAAGDSVTNTTTGHTLSNSLTAGSGTVTVDVLRMTATQGSIDVTAALSWNKRYPFRLVPGNNTLSVTGTGGQITYFAAYL